MPVGEKFAKALGERTGFHTQLRSENRSTRDLSSLFAETGLLSPVARHQRATSVWIEGLSPGLQSPPQHATQLRTLSFDDPFRVDLLG